MSDIIISIAQILFIVAMVPTFKSNEFPPTWTMILTVMGLFLLVVAMGLLGQWLSLLLTSVNLFLWGKWLDKKFKGNE